MKNYFVRLVLAFAVFVFSTVGTGLILGRIAWELRWKPAPSIATSPSAGEVDFSDKELLELWSKLSELTQDDFNVLTNTELERLKRLGSSDPSKLARFHELEKSRPPEPEKPKEPVFLYVPPALYAVLIGHALGGIFGLMAGRSLLRLDQDHPKVPATNREGSNV